MPHRTPRPSSAIAVGLALTLTACGAAVTPEEKAAQCGGLVEDVLIAQLAPTGVPDQARAKTSADTLDGRIVQLRDPAVHDAAVAIHTHLHAVETALAKGDTERAAKLMDAVREDLDQAARACDLPVSSFYGG